MSQPLRSLTTRRETFLICVLALLIPLFVLACNKGGRYEDDDDDGGGSQPTGFSLSGTIGAAVNTAVDLDTNDVGATVTANDNFGLAQDLPVPVILGGYVNRSRSGADGNSFVSGDPSDFYRITCTSGQTVFLSYSDDAALELHLYLYDADRRLVDASRGSGNTQSLTIAEAGVCFLEVFAEAGGGNYTLAINLAEITPAVSPPGLRLSDAFIPGEAIVSPAPGQLSALSALGLNADSDSGPHLLRFSVGGASGVHAALSGDPAATHRSRIDPADHDRLARWDTLETVRQLRRRADVAAVDLNYRRFALGLTPDDTYYDLQWHYSQIDLPAAWEETTGDADVLVAVIDSGVLLEHPDLAGKLVAGYDFIADDEVANDGDGRDNDPNDPGDSLLQNSSFHGTHVAGTVAALSDNAVGVAGGGWQTRVMPLRVLGVGGGNSIDLIQAIRYAAGLSNQSGERPARPADIINLSLGGESYSQAEQAAVMAARDAGVIIIAAAGNSGDATPHYPAAYDGVVSVSAVDALAQRAPYTSVGQSVDIAAPGGNTGADESGDGYPDGVLSTCGEESGDPDDPVNMVYCYYQGTSMAAPHVAAVAALMKALDPDMTPDQFDARLVGGMLTRDIGDSGRDELFGYGLVDAYRSVISALESPPTVALIEPAELTFDRTTDSLALAVNKLGEAPLEIVSLQSEADWLQTAIDAVDAEGFGTYAVGVDRSGLADGIYLADLDLTTSAGIRTVAVRMVVLAETSPGELANHYVLLIDSASGEVGAQAQADEETGQFRLTAVAAGSYFLIAGTDMDNDNFIGDAGEAFGAYLSLDNPVILSVDEDRSELDLVTNFRLALPGSLVGGMARFDHGGYPLSAEALKWPRGAER